MTNVKSLLEMYVKMGGSLTDTYADIAGGVPVGQYSTISDAVLACSKKYSAGGGGAEKFIVTLTQDNDTWTADKTIAEIIEAYEANQVVVAKYPVNSLYVELPISVADSIGGMSAAIFVGLDDREQGAPSIITVMCVNQGSGDVIQPETTPIPTSTNAPLIVTMTADQSTGNLVGDKTYGEVFRDFTDDKLVRFHWEDDGFEAAIDVLSAEVSDDTYSVALLLGGAITEANGTANEYITLNLGG